MQRIRDFFGRIRNVISSWWHEKLTYSWRSLVRMIIIAGVAVAFFNLVPQALPYVMSLALLWGIVAMWAFVEELLEEVTERRSYIDRDLGIPVAPTPEVATG